MPCVNCSLSYEEHVNGFAYDQRFGHECEGYQEYDQETENLFAEGETDWRGHSPE